jgi:preprotein translocase subunit YajC
LRDKLMNFSTNIVLAQAAPGAAGGGLSMLIMMIVLFGLMYFMMIRPQMKRQKEHRQMVSSLAKGDEVVSNGGIAGRVEEVGDTFITVEIAPNVKIKLQKSAVQQVLPKGTLKSS